jgi:hypothetical protein
MFIKSDSILNDDDLIILNKLLNYEIYNPKSIYLTHGYLYNTLSKLPVIIEDTYTFNTIENINLYINDELNESQYNNIKLHNDYVLLYINTKLIYCYHYNVDIYSFHNNIISFNNNSNIINDLNNLVKFKIKLNKLNKICL